MSFLAQLRQNQQPALPSGLQLCYVLRRRLDGAIVLALHMSMLEAGMLRQLGKPYLVQREHLQQPPDFLSTEDVEVLRSLLLVSDKWLVNHESGVFPEAVHGFLMRLLATKKSFVELSKGCFKQFAIEGRYSAHLQWQIDSQGIQTLVWENPKQGHLWLFNSQPYVYQEYSGVWTQGSAESISELAKIIKSQVPIEPNAVPDFLDCAGEGWSAKGLPLPAVIEQRVLKGSVYPILLCQGDSLYLGFRYASVDVCIQRLLVDEGQEFCVWDGEYLLTFARLLDKESEALSVIAPFVGALNKMEAGCWRSEHKSVWMDILLKQRSQLERLGFVFIFDENFKHHYIAPKNWSVDIKRDHEQWQFTLSFDAESQKIDVFDLLKQLKTFNQHSRLAQQEILVGGKTLILASDLLESLSSELSDLFEFHLSDGFIPLSQIYRLKKLQDQLPNSTAWSGATELLEQSIDLHSSPIMLDAKSSGVQAQLRPYQWLGVCWIQHLKQVGFNGLLADDMGLGKTLQTLAHLSLEKQIMKGADTPSASKKVSLIVAPTSLLSNWAGELKRFCPHLSYTVVHGGQRHSQWENIEHNDIVITSYPLVVRDIEQWNKQTIDWLILDEAQLIKNAQTKVSQAVRALTSEHRLCLSGTPVENHLGELWSILDFLEPNILGDQKQFRTYYQKAIEIDGNHQRFAQLLSRIEPFILRRTKNQVATDLPPKTQIQKLVTLSEEQVQLYEELKSNDWQSLSKQLDEAGNNGQKQILLLAALLRLRQVCCDPRLLDKESVIASAKTEYCMDMLTELADEGRAVLVFSQFTSMLDILAEKLMESNIDFLMLTGKSKNRSELVDKFQRGTVPVFLISLKAGGVGLNLTRADTVIHFDPWWNQAAEEQASDRAHRIGQKNPVFVYKLIAEATIEEKIALMQERKSLLSQQVNQQAQLSGETFALKLEDMMSLLTD